MCRNNSHWNATRGRGKKKTCNLKRSPGTSGILLRDSVSSWRYRKSPAGFVQSILGNMAGWQTHHVSHPFSFNCIFVCKLCSCVRMFQWENGISHCQVRRLNDKRHPRWCTWNWLGANKQHSLRVVTLRSGPRVTLSSKPMLRVNTFLPQPVEQASAMNNYC